MSESTESEAVAPTIGVDPASQEALARRFFDRPAPPDYLAEWARRLAQPEEAVQSGLESILVFRLHDEWLGISTNALVEVTEPHSVHSIPHRTNGVLRGLVNIRGQLRLCVSLHELLGVAATGTSTTRPADDRPQAASRPRMAILQNGADAWVVQLDEVLGIRHVSQTSFGKVPSTLANANAHTRGVLEWLGHTIGILDSDRLFESLRSLNQ